MNFDIDYINTHSEIRVLDKIYGEPSYHAFLDLKKKLKTNSLQVSSDLVDGAHGHLSLVLNTAEYTSVNATPYIKPVYSGALCIPVGTT